MVAQTVRHPPAMLETPVQSLGWKDLLVKRPFTQILPGEFRWTERPHDYSHRVVKQDILTSVVYCIWKFSYNILQHLYIYILVNTIFSHLYIL